MIDEEPVFAFPGVDWDWTTIGGYREAVARARPATNVTTFVGHNTLRRFVDRRRRPAAHARPSSSGCARSSARRSTRARAASRPGCRTRPGLFASVDELAALAGVAAERGLMYHTHMRYGDLDVRGSVAEALDTAERAGVDAQHLAHVPAGEPAARGGGHPPRACSTTPARRGVEVTFDLTIFPRGGGAWVQSLPGWARDGGNAAHGGGHPRPGVPGPPRSRS